MSAWLVSKGHIDTLVQALIVEGIIPLSEANEVGALLWLENHRSLNARYGDEIPEIAYAFSGIEAPLDDAIVLKQVHCYDYQTCEHAAWDEGNKAFDLVHALEDVLDRRTSGHYDGPWGVADIVEAVKR